jgi:putative transposase
MAEYRKGAHTVYDIKYQFVWVTKYRYPVLRGEIAERARDLIRQVCMAREITILKGHVSRDHVHLFVSATPNLSPARIMRYVKGKSSRLLQQEHPGLRKRYWGQHIWARGYFCATSGTVTDEIIKGYIEQQSVPPDDGFKVDDEARA